MNDIFEPSTTFKPLPVLQKAAAEKPYWRSLDELADSPEFRSYLQSEFPEKHEGWLDPMTRRNFLKTMGAGLGLMFMTACRRPLEKIFPYNEQPENQIPGKPVFYASALSFGGTGQGVIVETHEGRPTKIEGNAAHPDSLGATDIFMQAAVLGMYDPERSQSVIHRGVSSSWDSFAAALAPELVVQKQSQGASLRIVSEVTSSPSLLGQRAALLKEYPKAKWIQYEPLGRYNALQGASLAFGQPHEVRLDFSKADVILSLDANFFDEGPAKLRYARQFMAGRDLTDGRKVMNRLYVVEPFPTITGATADHRLALRASDVESFARDVARALHVPDVAAGHPLSEEAQRWIKAVAADLSRAGRKALVIAGDNQPPVVHALAHAMNQALGSIGTTVSYAPSAVAESANGWNELRQLAKDMEEKRVDVLIFLGGNPVYDAPVDLEFARVMDRVAFRARLGLYEDETSDLCHWHLPQAHALESWNDVRASDGTISIAQPMIEPLYGGKTPQEMLAIMLGAPASAHDIVKNFWKSEGRAVLFDPFWQKSLHDGIIPNTAFAAHGASVRGGFAASAPKTVEGVEVVFRGDPSVWDGRFANNAWLQELAKPLTKLTWDNAAHISPAQASAMGVENGDMISVSYKGRTLDVPVFVMPGHAADSVTITLGYGRSRSGSVGTGKGFNAYALRTSDAPNFGAATVQRKHGSYQLVTTQTHHSIEGREIVRGATLTEYIHDPKFAYRKEDWPEKTETLYNTPEWNEEVGWGMTIDLNTCTGCNACIIACQSENNISTVGKDQVSRGREMQWIRVDNYYAGNPENPETTHQPVPCMQCENAPCEGVCPVGATSHSDEGINQMVYNRCVGTRYCSNNCPYKVRRFNFYQFADNTTEQYKLMRNPDVTVRQRGVMEKCTYCIQRIQEVKIEAAKTDRAIKDGEIVTACQAACPTRAITFGNIRDPKSRVYALKTEPRNYAMLGDLNVRPRTTYLAKVRNVNPEI